MKDKLYWIWFASLPNLNKTSRTFLLDSFNSAKRVYHCTDFSEIPYLSLKEKTILMNKNLEAAEQILQTSIELGIEVITFDSPLYPLHLKEIHSPPYVLYAKGKIPDLNNILIISVVGTRSCTEYGISATRSICKGLAEKGVITVSGMARGIDSEVAASAIKHGGKTIAVFGCGLDICYPPENRELMNEILKDNLILSEFPPGTAPAPFHFPMRNRIMSGLSQGILIVESPKKGGSMISASLALEQGRDVFAIPGSIFNKKSEGTNYLISQGNAKSVSNADDIISEYLHRYTFEETDYDTVPAETEIQTNTSFFEDLDGVEKKIASLLLSGPLYPDEIQANLGISPTDLTSALSMLEFSGKVQRETGNIYKLKI